MDSQYIIAKENNFVGKVPKVKYAYIKIKKIFIFIFITY